jgi:hypothetical protein
MFVLVRDTYAVKPFTSNPALGAHMIAVSMASIRQTCVAQ